MSMTDFEFKEEVFKRCNEEKLKIKRRKRVILGLAPIFVAVCAVLTFNLLPHLDVAPKRDNNTAATENYADEENTGAGFEYFSRTIPTIAEDDNDSVDNSATDGCFKLPVTVEKKGSISGILDKEKSDSIQNAIEDMVNSKRNEIIADSQTQYDETIKPDYIITLTDRQGKETIYYIINDTLTNKKRLILCNDKTKVNSLISLIK